METHAVTTYSCSNTNSFRSAQSLFLNLFYLKRLILAGYLWRNNKKDKGNSDFCSGDYSVAKRL